MNVIQPEEILVDFPEPMLKLREEVVPTQEELLEDGEFDRRGKIYDQLGERN